MAPIAGSGESRFRPTPPGHLEAIVKAIRLVDIASLSPYEDPNQAKINEIAVSLQSSNLLINPVIVDVNRKLLIDGHHRVNAFCALGLDKIPAFTVDYLSDAVTVRGWSRTTDAPADDIGKLLWTSREPSGPWRVVVATSQQGEIASKRFATASAGAAYLEELSTSIRAHNHRVSLMTEAEALRSGLVHSYIVPVVGKQEVLDMVSQGQVFPYEVNRHLISDRPLGINTPLDVIADSSRFHHHLEWILQETTPLSIKSGFQHRERVYEEQVILFSALDRVPLHG